MLIASIPLCPSISPYQSLTRPSNLHPHARAMHYALSARNRVNAAPHGPAGQINEQTDRSDGGLCAVGQRTYLAGPTHSGRLFLRRSNILPRRGMKTTASCSLFHSRSIPTPAGYVPTCKRSSCFPRNRALLDKGAAGRGARGAGRGAFDGLNGFLFTGSVRKLAVLKAPGNRVITNKRGAVRGHGLRNGRARRYR